MKDDMIVVTGAGGFIGGHLVAEFLRQGFCVRAADIKPLNEWYQVHREAENFPARCKATAATSAHAARSARARERSTTSRPTWAAWASSRTTRPCACSRVLINTHLLMAAQGGGRRALLLRQLGLRLQRRQAERLRTSTALKEEDAYPAMPEDGYGWEKLFSERMCRHFREDFGLSDARRPLPQRLRPARHLGRRPRKGAGRHLPQGDRRPSSPASTRSRSGATATRPAASCTSTTASTASQAIMRSRHRGADQPRQFSELVTINRLVDIVEDIAGVKLKRKYNLDAPRGVERPQQRQHADPRAPGLGAEHPPARRHGEDLRLDLR